MRYLEKDQLTTNLSLGKSVEQWLSFESKEGYTILRWLRINKERDSKYTVNFTECFDDGNGPGDHLVIQIEDLSPPVAGLLVNMQAFKDNMMTNITDTVSMDGNPSATGILKAGNGIYFISVNKTDAGSRTFNVTWHCETSNNLHTGSEITVLQVQ